MPNHYRLKLLVVAMGVATASVATAATTKTLHAQNLGTVPASSLAAQLNLGQDMSLVPRSEVSIASGHKVVRQQQMFRGVPVYGRSIAVVQDAQANALRASGELMQDAQLGLSSVAPQLNATRALSALQAHAHTALVGGTTISNQN